jgi:aspartyl-tRNA(Asn)/glutamyl-tRNA(Gln) amidotransferase subunit B
VFQTGEMPLKIVKEKSLEVSVDTDELQTLCEEVIAAFPKPVAEYRAGKEKALNVLKGQLMKRTQGKVLVSAIDKVLAECLKG